MKQNSIEYELIWKKISSSLSLKEEEKFELWLQSNSKHKKYYERAKFFHKTGRVHDFEGLDIYQAWKNTEPHLSERKNRTPYFWTKIAGVAAILVLCVVSAYMVLNIEPTEIPLADRLKMNIPPGVSIARLTLENGEVIDLGEENQFVATIKGTEIKNEKAKLVYKTKTTEKKIEFVEEIHELNIPRGGKYFLELEDGSKVWINSETILKYPVVFSLKGDRIVELNGEAYFEVAKDTSRPFKVKINGQTIEVLGTEFNVSSYNDEAYIYTTLVEGKVKVTNNKNPKDSFSLEPGYQHSYFKETGSAFNSKVDVNQYISWRYDVYKFKSKRLDDIMKTLSRWYDINIIFEKEKIKEIRFTGEINRVRNFEDIIEILEKTNEVKFKSDYEGIVIY